VFSVVIATLNRAQSLRRTLESLGQIRPPEGEWEVVVVDNASTDGTREAVTAFAATAPMPVRHLMEPRRGKSFALNRGILATRGDFLAFTDDDVIVDPGCARALAAAGQRRGCLGAGGRIVAEWTDPPPKWLAVDGQDRAMNVVAFDVGDAPGDLSAPPFGPNMGFRRIAFDRYGMFRTDLGPGSGRYLPGQDTEFGRRLLRAGERLAWAPDAVVRHVMQTDKMTKRYIASWYFGYGRMRMRTDPLPADTVRYVGVPRYLVRNFLVTVGRWAICAEPRRRFRYRLEASRLAGAITEAIRARGRP
jgi:glycosyltransferase involved in cell wall biosynthesis